MHEQVAPEKKYGAVPDVKIDLKNALETHADDVFNYIYRRGMPTREDAEDLTSDVFVEYYKNPGAFRGESGIRTWLYGIADNLRRDFYRRRERLLRAVPYDEADEDNPMRVAPAEVDAFPQPEDDCLRNEEKDKLQEILSHLNEEHRKVIVLRQCQKLSVRETAQEMNKTESAVKMLQMRAMQNLSERMCEDPFFSAPPKGGNFNE